MVKLLNRLISCVSETIGALDEFYGKEIGYFLDDESPSLKSSISAIDKAYTQLRGLLLKLQRLQKELCVDNPQGVSKPS
jgi:hypothetical protein